MRKTKDYVDKDGRVFPSNVHHRVQKYGRYLFELLISFCLYFSYLMVQKGFCVPYNKGCK